MQVFEFYTPPDQIKQVKNIHAFAAQANDPQGAYEVGIGLSSTWRVTIDDRQIPVLMTPVTFRGPHHFCQLRYLDAIQSATIHISHKDGCQLSVRSLMDEILTEEQDGGILLHINGCGQITIEADNRPNEPLSIFISQPEVNRPDRNDPNVIWFGPGIHLVDRLVLEDNQTVYLENGAIIQAIPPHDNEKPIIEDDWAHVPEYDDFIKAKGKKNIVIRGMGIIETTRLSWHARRTIFLEDCSDVCVEGIITVGSAHWTIVPYHCDNVRIHDAKVFGYRTNSDAIDLVNCQNVEVSQCYLRTGDDAVCLKGMLPPNVIGGKNVTVHSCTIWTEKARSLGIIGETRGDFSDISFYNCLILHGYANWTRELGSLCIVLSDGGTVEGVTFRDIRIVQEDSWVIDCMIRPDFWSTDQMPGMIRKINFINLTIPEKSRINLQGYDADHCIEELFFEEINSEDEKLEISIERNQFVNGAHMNL